MLKETLKGALTKLPHNSYVKIGSKKGISFFYCDKVGSKEPLYETINKISSNYLRGYRNRLKLKKIRLANLDNIYDEKIKQFNERHKDIKKQKAYIVATNNKKEKERKNLPIAIMSLTTKIQEFTPLLKRTVVDQVIGISPDEPNTIIIYISGNEKGNYWTIKEYQDRHAKKKRGLHDKPYAVK